MIKEHLPASHGFEPGQLRILQSSFEKLEEELGARSELEKAVLASTLIEVFTGASDAPTAERKAAGIYKNCIAPLRRLAPGGAP